MYTVLVHSKTRLTVSATDAAAMWEKGDSGSSACLAASYELKKSAAGVEEVGRQQTCKWGRRLFVDVRIGST